MAENESEWVVHPDEIKARQILHELDMISSFDEFNLDCIKLIATTIGRTKQDSYKEGWDGRGRAKELEKKNKSWSYRLQKWLMITKL